MFKAKTRLTVYSIAHFTVDLFCAYVIFTGTHNARVFLLYNFLAFAMQMPIGALADKLNKNSLIAGIGALFVALSVFARMGSGFFAASVAGLGNALFHVGGGTDVLNSFKGSKMLGIFVSPGAAGLFLGTIAAKAGIELTALALLPFIPAVIMLVPGLMSKKKFNTENVSFDLLIKKKDIFPFILIALVVIIRSFAGMQMAFSWKQGIYSYLVIAAVVLGKMLGGFFCDRFGAFYTSLISLALAGVLFIFSDNPAAGIAAVLLFNMTMPITLYEAGDIFKNAKGFSFGILTFGLFLGFLPSYFGISLADAGLILSSLCILSIALILPGIKLREIYD